MNKLEYLVKTARGEPWDWDFVRQGLYIDPKFIKEPKREKYHVDKALREMEKEGIIKGKL